MKSILLRSSLFAALTIAFAGVGFGNEITEEEFRDLQKVLTPDQNERWRTIPWKIALLEAQRTAAEQGKPIFIWAMDGHPLGCT